MNIPTKYDIRKRLHDMAIAGGHGVMIGIPTDGAASAATNVFAPDGCVAVVTKVFGQCSGMLDTSPNQQGRPEALVLYDTNNNVVYSMPFMTGNRVNRVHNFGADTPTHLSAIPNWPLMWELSDPIVVPPGWTLKSLQIGDAQGVSNGFACYGYLMSASAAIQCGLDPEPDAAKRRQVYFGSGIWHVEKTLVEGRSGFSVKISDIVVRIQPMLHRTPYYITIYQDDGTTERPIFRFINNNPADLIEVKFSPQIYLKPGAALKAIANVNTGNPDGGIVVESTVAGVARYVPTDQVPDNHFWACELSPKLPTPNAEVIDTGLGLDNVKGGRTEMTVYYPKTDTTGVTPGIGYQYVARGFCNSIQKDETAGPDQLYYALMTNFSSLGTRIGVQNFTGLNVGYNLGPIMHAASHDMNSTYAVDDLFIPCPAETGTFWVSSMAWRTSGVLPSLTPTSTDADVDEWAVTVWGERVQERYSTYFWRGLQD